MKSLANKINYITTGTLLLIALVIFFIVGIRTVFSSQKIGDWVETAVTNYILEGFQKENINIEFEKAQTTVLGSISYPLGIRIKNLKIEFKKDCDLYEGSFKTVVLPLHFMKVIRKEIELGLVRISDGTFKVVDTCFLKENVKHSKKTPMKPNDVEEKFTKIIKKISHLDLSMLKDSSNKLRFLGVLIYNFKFYFGVEKEFFLDRFKILLGTGELVAGGEWTAKLISPEGVAELTGSFKASEQTIKMRANLKEKEGRLSVQASILRKNTDELAQFNVTVSDFPLSIVSRFKKFNLAGLNLRKTWINLNLNLKVFNEKIFVNVDEFKTHGDFGNLELKANGFQALWSSGDKDFKWTQFKKAEIKLSDISLEEIIGIKPKKKARGVFGEFGKLNAFLTLENLSELKGDFEMKDFSILFRSMGESAYQNAKHARGKLGFIFDKKLFFILNEVDLVDGDFEGFIGLEYSYIDKNLYTKFEIPYLKLNAAIFEELFKIKFRDKLEINGEGQALKTVFTGGKLTEKKPLGNLHFILESSSVDLEEWGLLSVRANCTLNGSELQCKLQAKELNFSKKLLKKLKVLKSFYEEVKSDSFAYKEGILLFNLKNKNSNLFFRWTKEQGLSLYPNGYDKASIRLRNLD